MVGIGSSVFHPESSRVARLASGGRHGFAQSLFQVGGNIGSSTGPLLAAYIVLPYGQRSIAWFGVGGAVGDGDPDARQRLVPAPAARVGARQGRGDSRGLPTGRVRLALLILVLLVFSKNVYLASLTSFYTFYLIDKFQLTRAERAAAPVRAARSGRRRDVHRRPGRRSHRPQVRDLGLDPRRAAVHAAAAVREPAAGPKS